MERATLIAYLDAERATEALQEREITQLIKERDSSENAIDKILDRVLGEDRTEWSNAYQIGDAIDEVDVAVTTLEKECAAARAEIARLREDAARYRWLRGDVPSHSIRWVRWEVRNWTGRYWDDTRKDGLDAAIDAAMKGE